MTEPRWLAAADPVAMLDAVLATVSDRKLRLFACALFADQSRWGVVADVVAVGERYADGAATRAEIEQAQTRAKSNAARQAVYATVSDDIKRVLRPVFSYEFVLCTSPANHEQYRDLLREVFGNPCRPVAFDPAWLTRDVRDLAALIDARKSFELKPILADALQDAGCDTAAILDHCRGESTHVKGCWVLDLILAKS